MPRHERSTGGGPAGVCKPTYTVPQHACGYDRPMSGSGHHPWFILEAVDLGLCCPVLQARFQVSDLDVLRVILNLDASDDPDLDGLYTLEPGELEAINRRFSVGFQPDLLGLPAMEIGIFRWRAQNSEAPYLVHTRYELPLMLDGLKTLSRFLDPYPPMQMPGGMEERFDRWVREGRLHKETVLEPFDGPVGPYEGIRTVYYTPIGEEWRIAASKMIWRAAKASGGWNEYFERLEGMLFGYDDWKNDWWIANSLKQGRWAGLALCCSVSAAGLDWIRTSGFRALPPMTGPFLPVRRFDWQDDVAMRSFMMDGDDGHALVRFHVPFDLPKELLDIREQGPWLLPTVHLPDLNRYLLRSITPVCVRSP